MSHIIPKHLIRRGLALLVTATAVGCSSGDNGTGPGAIALAIVPTSASVVQGGSADVAATVTRSGGFTGIVTLTVTGAPTGVTSVVSNVQTVGLVTTATITISVDPATAFEPALPGTYSLVVHGTNTSVTEATATFALTVTAPTPSYTLSLSAAALSILQGSSTPTTTVNITRVNFTGDVTLSVTGLPTGVTAAFAPANPQTGNSSVLTLTVGAAVLPAVYNLTVDGTATAGNQSTPLALTVTAPIVGDFTLTTTPATTANVTQGASANVTVNINRTGGNVSDIALTATGTLPAGLTLAFAPTSTTTNSSVLTITTTAATPVGTYPIVIHGNTTGLGEQLVTLNIVVAAPSGSGNVSLSFATCAAADKAVWVAFQDGSGPWVPVTGVNDLYQFNITQSKGGVAYVVSGTGASTINVFYYSQAELTAATLNFCAAAATGKTVNATVANLPAGAQGRVSFGGGIAVTLANGPVQLTDVLDGPQDVVAYAGPLPLPGPSGSDRVFLARGLNPANGGSLGTVDFTGAGSSTVASAAITLVGGAGGETLSQAMSYHTGAACTTAILYAIGPVAGSPFTAYGVDAASQVATDFHSLSVFAFNGTTSFRLVTESFHTLAARTVTLPSALGTVTASDAGGAYKRLMLVTTLPADLNSSAVATYTDQTVVGKGGTIIATAAWLGGLSLSLTLPDFSALAGWSNAWAPATSDNLQWTLSGAATSLTSLCSEGARVASSTKTGTL